MPGLRNRRNPLEDEDEGINNTPVTDPDKVTRMPDPEDPLLKQALLRRALQRMRTQGRGSTVLTKLLRNRTGM